VYKLVASFSERVVISMFRGENENKKFEKYTL